MTNIDLTNITLEENCDFVDAMFIFQDFISESNILETEINLHDLLNDYSEKIHNLKKYNNFEKDSLFILLYSSIMLYNDLANPYVKNKMKLKQFIKMLNGCNSNNNFPIELLNDIYKRIYNKIKMDISNNIIELDNLEVSINKKNKTCIIL